MTENPSADLILLLTHELIEDDEQARDIQNMIDMSPESQALKDQLNDCLQAPELEAPPAAVWERLTSQIEADKQRRRDIALNGPHIPVRLRCSFCRDDLGRDSSIYCASCLAPYHEDCFVEHGRCAIQGCSEHRIIRSQEAPARKRNPWKQAAAYLFTGLVFSGAAVAALRPSMQKREKRLMSAQVELFAARAEAEKWRRERNRQNKKLEVAVVEKTAEIDAMRNKLRMELANSQGKAYLRVYDVSDLTQRQQRNPRPVDRLSLEVLWSRAVNLDDMKLPPWIQEYRRALVQRRVTLNFDRTPLSDVVNFIRDITGLNLTLSSAVDSQQEVSMRVRDLSLLSVFRLLLRQIKDVSLSFENETIAIHEHRREVTSGQSDTTVDAYQAQFGFSDSQKLMAQELAALVRQQLGDNAWIKGTELEVVRGQLIIRQTLEQHKAVEDYLLSLRRARLAADIDPKYWFAPATGFVKDPAQEKIEAWTKILKSRKVSVNFDQTPLNEVLMFMRDITNIPFSMSAKVQKEDLTVSLRLKEISLDNCVRLLASVHEDVVFDIDRNGLFFRFNTEQPLEHRLRRRAHKLFTQGQNKAQFLHSFEKSLKNKLSLSVKNEPALKVLLYIQDISGLNLTFSRASEEVLKKQSVSLSLKKVSAQKIVRAFTQALGLRLDYEPESMVIDVKRASPDSLTPTPERVAQLEAKPMKDGGYSALTLGDFAKECARITGAYVVFPYGVSTRARMRVPPQATLYNGLSQAKTFMGLSWAWGLMPDGRLILALDTPKKGLLIDFWIKRESKLKHSFPMPASVTLEIAKLDADFQAMIEHLESVTRIQKKFKRESWYKIWNSALVAQIETLVNRRDDLNAFIAAFETHSDFKQQQVKLQEILDKELKTAVLVTYKLAQLAKPGPQSDPALEAKLKQRLSDLKKVNERLMKAQEKADKPEQQRLIKIFQSIESDIRELREQISQLQLRADKQYQLKLARLQSQRHLISKQYREAYVRLAQLNLWQKTLEKVSQVQGQSIPSWSKIFPKGYRHWITRTRWVSKGKAEGALEQGIAQSLKDQKKTAKAPSK